MDTWERCVRKAYVRRSNVAVKVLNLSLEDRKRDEVIAAVVRERRRVNATLALAILLLKLNSKSSKAIQWASGLTRGPEDVA